MKGWFYGILLVAAVGLLTFVMYDLLFSPPIVQEGVIVELIYVPGKNVATYTPFRAHKIGDHAIVVAREEQWIAAVLTNTSDSLQVHCTKEHYDNLKVGDPLRFKKYEGQVFHIRYFAHYEDH
jgi:hypothetical protein